MIPEIQPLDLIFFRGTEVVSKTIVYLTKRQQKRRKVCHGRRLKKHEKCKKLDAWYSHVGLVLSRDLYDDPRLISGKLYVLEATYTGKNDDGVPNIDGDPTFGVQIRALDDILAVYTQSDSKKKLAWSEMVDNPFRQPPSPRKRSECQRLQAIFTSWCREAWEGMQYDANPLSLLAALYCPLRRGRDCLERIFNVDGWLFCSELVAQVARTLELIPRSVNPKNVLPMDLVGFDLDGSSEDGIHHGEAAPWKLPLAFKKQEN